MGNGLAEKMTGKQMLFVEEYLKDQNGTRAAEAAGYKKPSVAGCELTNKAYYPLVAGEIERRLEERRKLADVEAAQVVRELCKVAFVNPQDLYDEHGVPIPIHLLPRDVAAAIKSYKVSHRVGKDTDGKPMKVRLVEMSLHSKLDALKQVAVLLGFVKEPGVTNNNTTNTVVFDWGKMTSREEVVDLVDQKIKAERLQLPHSSLIEKDHVEEGE